MTAPATGFEPVVFGFVDRRLIRWTTRGNFRDRSPGRSLTDSLLKGRVLAASATLIKEVTVVT